MDIEVPWWHGPVRVTRDGPLVVARALSPSGRSVRDASGRSTAEALSNLRGELGLQSNPMANMWRSYCG